MRTVAVAAAVILAGAAIAVVSSSHAGRAASLTPVQTLERAAAEAADVTPRTALQEPPAGTPASVLAPDGSVPNYLRALGAMPHVAAPLGRLVDTFLLEGRLPTPLKAAMGLRIAQVTGSEYVAAHVLRLLRGAAEGRALLAAFEDEPTAAIDERDALALAYAETLTRDVNGVRDPAFRDVRAHFNDAEVIELTMTVSFFNFLARYAEALRLPVEAWASDPVTPPQRHGEAAAARVALLSDEEIAAAATAAARAQAPEAARGGLGLGLANSQRAMLRVPALAAAWQAVGAAARNGEQVGRDIKLQVSLAVSMANGCRYCTLHQILGLRRLGVDPGTLVALKKDDAALTPRERIAVRFARTLTQTPVAAGDEEFAALLREFGPRGALEIVLQTCTFAFMNRFTDGLRLPSEDEAIRVYQEVYGTGTE